MCRIRVWGRRGSSGVYMIVFVGGTIVEIGGTIVEVGWHGMEPLCPFSRTLRHVGRKTSLI